MVGLIWAVWRAGRRLTPWNALATALLCAAALGVKFSALLLGPIVAVLLLLRALMPQPWETSWRPLKLRSEKLAIAMTLALACFVISTVGLWAAYGFRFGPSRDASVEFNIKRMTAYTAYAELTLKSGGQRPTDAQIDAWQPSGMARAILFLTDLQGLPQAWLDGLLYTYQSALLRKTFLLGQYSETGWWYYFPFAMLVKTPLATLSAVVLAVGVLVVVWRRVGWRSMVGWTAACLVIPPAAYLISAMASNLNLGLRHVLPVYPFLYLGIGLAAGEAWRRFPRLARYAGAVLALLLAVETLLAFPNYIPFFNLAAGGERGGIRLLGDSNLDWGQDLKLLAQWQQDHPDENLYLVYFGIADPWAYGIRYVNFPGGYPFGAQYQLRTDPGVLAISATNLQGIYSDQALRDAYGRLKELEPIDVLGGSIYLYRWPPPPVR
jgi:hypothetical protein